MIRFFYLLNLALCETSASYLRDSSSTSGNLATIRYHDHQHHDLHTPSIRSRRTKMSPTNDCNGEDIVQFQSVVFIEFSKDLTNLTAAKVAHLENSFKNTYNTLNAALCDPYHRHIVNVSLEWPLPRRHLESIQPSFQQYQRYQDLPLTDFHVNDTRTNASQVVANASQVLEPDGLFFSLETSNMDIARFSLNVACYGCPTNSSLFAAFSSNLTVPSHHLPLSSILALSRAREKDLVTDRCKCIPKKSTPFRPPSPMEFEVAYNETTEKSHGGLEVEESVEVDVVNCTGQKQNFTSNVVANLEGNPELMTEEERVALERSFLETYNALTFARCDSKFRQVVEVRLVSGLDSRRLVEYHADFDVMWESNATYSNSTDGNHTNDEDFDMMWDFNGTYSNSTGRNYTTVGNITNSTQKITSSAPKRKTPAVYQVFGSCRNCEVSDSGTFTLFDEAFRLRRSLLEDSWLQPSR